MEEPGFWDEPEQSTRMVRESKNLKDEVDTYRALEQQYEDIQVMIQMGYEENDSSLIPEIEEMLEQFKETLENMRMKLLLSGEYDSNNAILRLNAGDRNFPVLCVSLILCISRKIREKQLHLK